MRVRTVRHQVRLLVAGVCLLMVAVAGSMTAALARAGQDLTLLTTCVGPARDANAALLQAMTDAETGLRGYQATADPALLAPYRGAADRVGRAQADLADDLSGGPLPATARAGYQALQRTEDAAAARWAAYARAELGAVGAGHRPDVRAGKALFDAFRAANAALSDRLQAQRVALRDTARRRINQTLLVILGATVLALAGALLLGRVTVRALSGPLAQLRQVVRQQRTGHPQARADTGAGATEVRELAADFNALATHNAALLAQMGEALRLQQVSLDIERVVRAAGSVQQALDAACAVLGPALGVDRLMANTVDADLAVSLGAQWHTDALGDLPDIPAELLPFVGRVCADLWSGPGRLAVDDLADAPGAYREELARFSAETGARAALLVPIGLGEQVIGVVYALSCRGTRAWTSAEVAVVVQVCSHLGRAISQHEHVARLERLDRQKTDFLSTVSHELRTPLTSIAGYLELLGDGDAGTLSAPQQRMLEVIGRNTVRLRGLIEDLLVLNRIETGGLHVTNAPVRVAELVAHTLEELAPLAAAKDLRLTVAGDGLGAACVTGDRGHLQRALVNIVANAVKFTPPGGAVTLRGARTGEGAITLACTDTGIGIPREDLDQLFGRFFRARNAAAAAIPGTGLGLAICKTIVEDHGGALAVDSVEGRGTTVTLTLPVPAQGQAQGRDRQGQG